MKEGEQFLLEDWESAGGRVLLFATADALDVLGNEKIWYIDGTFKSCPSIFYQVLTIQCIVDSVTIPCVYALLPDKNQFTYADLYQKLRPHIASTPEEVMVDFEQANINALKESFPGAHIQGCYFHFSQCIWRKIQSSGLQVKYQSDEEFSGKLRSLAALAFVPASLVEEAFDNLSEVFPDTATEILDYFEDNFIGRPNPKARQGQPKRRAPRFPIDLWNVYNKTVDDEPRTNNSIEGFHRGFESLVACIHPTIWKFFAAIQKQHGMTQYKLDQINSGAVLSQQSSQYKDNNTRIKRIVCKFNGENILEYLHFCGLNIKF